MKKLALLFLVLPIPALASPATDQLRLRQAAEARTVCTANDQGPGTPQYGRCVNMFLKYHYGWEVVQRRDGSLGVGVPNHSLPQYF
jgi:hypothetical protein